MAETDAPAKAVQVKLVLLGELSLYPQGCFTRMRDTRAESVRLGGRRCEHCVTRAQRKCHEEVMRMSRNGRERGRSDRLRQERRV